MSKYYNPTDGRHIPNPMLRTREWAKVAHVSAPEYEPATSICRYDGKQWVLEPNYENEAVAAEQAAQEREALITAKVREMAEAELIAEGKLEVKDAT